MPKLKTKRALAKRVKVTGRGKLMRHQSGKSHLLSSKSRKRKRQLSRPRGFSPGDERRLKKLLP